MVVEFLQDVLGQGVAAEEEVGVLLAEGFEAAIGAGVGGIGGRGCGSAAADGRRGCRVTMGGGRLALSCS
jgi:hypothetical protein